jgi:hypothetical protein
MYSTSLMPSVHAEKVKETKQKKAICLLVVPVHAVKEETKQ